MNKLSKIVLLIMLLVFWVVGSAQATNYAFNTNDGSGNKADMMDLDHNYYYGWGISDTAAKQLENELLKGYVITSATLVYKNIWNWQHETNDQLATFLLSDAPKSPGVETVPVTVGGVAQGHYLYTYTKTTTKGPYNSHRQDLVNQGYTETKSGNKYYYTKTSTITKASSTCLQNTNPTAPTVSGYTLDTTKTKFTQDTVTLKDGIVLVKGNDNFWERYDGQSKADVKWNVANSTLIWDDPAKGSSANANPWHDAQGGKSRNFDLTYNFDDTLINLLTEYALDGTFGFGIDPDCHYYNDGVTFTVTTMRVPEPTTMLLLGFGLVGLAGLRRKFKG